MINHLKRLTKFTGSATHLFYLPDKAYDFFSMSGKLSETKRIPYQQTSSVVAMFLQEFLFRQYLPSDGCRQITTRKTPLWNYSKISVAMLPLFFLIFLTSVEIKKGQFI